jgi:DNA-binding NarL/FixJ family response regulator
MNTQVSELEQNRSWVAYLHLDGDRVDKEISLDFEFGIRGSLKICNSWLELIGALNTRQRYLRYTIINEPTVVLIHMSSLLDSGSTITEMANMLTTLNRCLTADCSKLAIGAVVDSTCTTELVKQIRNAGFAGLIPDFEVFGVEKTIEGVNTLLSSRLYWPKDVIDEISGAQKKQTVSNSGIVLTSRQKEVMDLIRSRGLSNKQIGQILKISDSTVKVHVTAILKKHGVRTRTQLMAGDSKR